MAITTPSRILVVLALIAGAGALSVASAPSHTHIGYMWPVGLATGLLLAVSRRVVLPTLLLLLAVTLATFAADDLPFETLVGFSVVTTAEAWLVQRMLPRRSDGRAWLLINAEFISYALSCLAGSLAGGLGFGAVSALTGYGMPWQVAVAASVTHLASQLVLVPLFLEVPPMVLPRERRESLLRWVMACGITVVAFVPNHVPSLIFLVMPVLAWTAVRAPMRETHYQLLTVAGIASAASSLGGGPFATFVADGSLVPELARIPQQAFLISCVLVSVPFAITVRQQRESQREAATQRSRSDRLIRSAEGLVIMGTDDLGRINLFNPGAEKVLGYSAAEVEGESPDIFHTPHEIERLAGLLGCKPDFYSVIAAYLEQRPGVPMDWEFVRRDGEKRILSFTLSTVSDDHGGIVGFIAAADDVTERVRAREELERSAKSAREAEQVALQRLAEVDRAKDSFVSAVSHELRTPITSLLGYLEMLQDGSYGEVTLAQRQALDRIGLNSGRLLALIDDLLALAKVEELDLGRAQTPTDLSTIVRDAGADLTRLVEERHLRVHVDVPTGDIVVPGDTAQLRRMVTSLADNAAKFTPDGGTITLSLHTLGHTCTLGVADTGVGIPEHQQPHIFERFFRSSYADEDAVAGTGIGLYMTKAIAEAHGATISFCSAAGVGTTFEVHFPHAQVTTAAS